MSTLIASGVDPGDIGVLTTTNQDAVAVLSALRAAGFGAIGLENYSGVAAPLAKVRTINPAKCLDFEQVLLARVKVSPLALVAEGLDDGGAEARAVALRELHVGLTRASDEL